MASTPTNGSSLVHSKGIKSIQLLCAREAKARLDVGPFNIIYAATVVYGLVLAGQGRMCAASQPHCTPRTHLHRDDARLLAYAAGAFVLLQVLLKLFMHWVVEVKATTAFFRAPSLTTATHVMVRARDVWHRYQPRAGRADRICRDQGDCATHPPPAGAIHSCAWLEVHLPQEDGRVELAFDYRKQKMVFSGEEGAFVELPYPVKVRHGAAD